jgi:hypothetical protein
MEQSFEATALVERLNLELRKRSNIVV